MIQALSRRPVSAEDRLRHQANRCGICGDKAALRQAFFSPGFRFSPVIVIAPAVHIHSLVYHRL